MTKLYKELYKLKNIERRGWLLRNMKDSSGRVESDAEHTFSMSLLAIEIMEKEKLNLNKEKVLKMVLYHELGEIGAGDITPVDDINREEKYNLEKDYIEKISINCNMPEIYELWKEFEENKTPEAIFVKKIDKLDTIIQCKIYSEINNKPEVYEEFYSRWKPLISEFLKYID